MSGGESRQVRSVRKSPLVRYEDSLCSECNNARSQAFDRAYDQFANYVWDLQSRDARTTLDLRLVYGTGAWESGGLDLARYVVKHFGCRMNSERFPVPRSFVPFLNGGEPPPDVRLVLFFSERHQNLWLQSAAQGEAFGGVGVLDAPGLVSPSQQRLTAYSSGILIGSYGIGYEWMLDGYGGEQFCRTALAIVHGIDGWRSFG
jgi:hypothetical protein